MTPPATEKEVKNFQRLASAMNNCMLVTDRQHRAVYANPAFEKTTGYKLHDLQGKNCAELFDTKSTTDEQETTIHSKDGDEIPVLLTSTQTEDGGQITFFHSISAEKELMRQEKIADQIIRNTQEGIVILDIERNVQMWNHGAEKIFGYSESDMVGQPISTLIPDSEEEANIQLRADVEKNVYINNIEVKRLAKSGQLLDVTLSATRVTDEQNNHIGYLIIYRDISQRKRQNTELQKRLENIQDAYKELGLQKRQSDFLHEIVDLADKPEATTEDLGRLIVSAITMLTKADGVVLRLSENSGNSLKLLSSIGVNEKWIAKNKITFKNSLAMEAHKNNRPIVLDNVDSFTKHASSKLLKEHGFKTLFLVPLSFQGQMVGTISLYSTNPSKFRLIETDFLERFAKQCSLALYLKWKNR